MRLLLNSATHTLKKIPAFACIACAMLSQTPLWAADLPMLGDSVSAIVSPEDERVLGNAYLRSIRGGMPLITDASLNQYIADLTINLASAHQNQLPPIKTIVVNASTINAFAVPGGLLGINAGLLLYTTNEAELAAVIAHELAHLSQRHYARGVEYRERTKWATYTGLLASLALMAATNSNTGIAGVMATQAASIDAQLQFSRQNEREADRVGMQALYNAGIPPQAMPAFFGRLLKSKQFSGREDYEFLSTHPVTQTRIADSMARADQYLQQDGVLPGVSYKTTESATSDFYFMKARVAAAYAPTPQAAVKSFKSQLTATPSDAVAAYGLARAYIRNNQPSKAIATIEEFNASLDVQSLTEPDALTSPFFQLELVKIEAYLDEKEFNTALDLVDNLSVQYPQSKTLAYYTSDALIGLKHYKKAQKLLEQLLANDPENILYLQNILLVHQELNNRVDVYLNQAQLEFSRGQYDSSLTYLSQAFDLVGSDNLPLKSKIKTRIRDIQKLKVKLRQFSG